MKYLTVTEPEKFWFLDIEANSLTPDKIWCAVFLNKATRQVVRLFNNKDIKDFIEQRKDHTFCGHNLLSYDWYWLSVLCGFDYQLGFKIDSLVLSYLYNPILEGGHSLEAYGERLKFPKKEHTDWTKYSPEMLEYCENDVYLAEKVYDALTKKMNKIGYSELSVEIEHKIRVIIDQQQRNGFWFDRDRTSSLLSNLRLRSAGLAESIHKLFPPNLEEVGHYKRRTKKDGTPTSQYELHIEKGLIIEETDDGGYSTFQYEPFNIGSPKQRLERLLKLGYKPTAKTKKGNPRIDEDSLLLYAKECNRPEIEAMAQWLVCTARANMIENWLGFVGPDSRIHGKVFSCGASTRRMRHNFPNTANIPSPHKVQYGKECRELWGVEPNKGLVLVGADAAGLENVGLLHYLNNKKAEEILGKPKPYDVHTMNAKALTKALGREIDREWGSKTSFFAFIFGAYPPKLGEIVKGSAKDGQVVIDTLFKNVPGLKQLIEKVQNEWKSSGGRLFTIDGGSVLCPSLNAALNYWIQSLGSIVMKLACIILHDKVTRQGLYFKLVGFIHDEWQMETKKEDAETIGKMAIQSMTEAAEQLNLNVKLTGEYKIGNTWLDTH